MRLTATLLLGVVSASKIRFSSTDKSSECQLVHDKAGDSIISNCDIELTKEVKGETHHSFSLRGLNELIEQNTKALQKMQLAQACLPGHYKLPGADQACVTRCEKDTYDATPYNLNAEGQPYDLRFNLLACTTCPAGSFTTTLGQTKCDLCGPGHRFDATQADFCSPCPANTFSDDVSAECKPCEGGRHTAGNTGQSTCAYCPEGHQLSGDKCEPCMMAYSGLNDLTCQPYSKCSNGYGLKKNFQSNSFSEPSMTTIFRQNSYYCEACQAKEFSDELSFSYCEAHSKCAYGLGAVHEGVLSFVDDYDGGAVTKGDFDSKSRACRSCTGQFYSHANTFDVCYKALASEGYQTVQAGAGNQKVSCAGGWVPKTSSFQYFSSGEVMPNQCRQCNSWGASDDNFCGGSANVQSRCSATQGTACCPSLPAYAYRDTNTVRSGTCNFECHSNYKKSGNSCVMRTSYTYPRHVGVDNGRGGNCGGGGHFFNWGCHDESCLNQNSRYVTRASQCQEAAQQHGRPYYGRRGYSGAPHYPCGCYEENGGYYFNNIYHGQHCSWWYPVRGLQICKN